MLDISVRLLVRFVSELLDVKLVPASCCNLIHLPSKRIIDDLECQPVTLHCSTVLHQQLHRAMMFMHGPLLLCRECAGGLLSTRRNLAHTIFSVAVGPYFSARSFHTPVLSLKRAPGVVVSLARASSRALGFLTRSIEDVSIGLVPPSQVNRMGVRCTRCTLARVSGTSFCWQSSKLILSKLQGRLGFKAIARRT